MNAECELYMNKIIALFSNKDGLKILHPLHCVFGNYDLFTKYCKIKKSAAESYKEDPAVGYWDMLLLAEELVGCLVVEVHGFQHVLVVFVAELCKAIFDPGKDAGVDHVSFSIFIVGDGNYVIVVQISCGDIGDVYVVLTALCYGVRAMVLVLPAASA